MASTAFKIGDLVETCAMEPGYIVSIDGDDVEVENPNTKDTSSHSIRHCGVHKITKEYADMLWTIGNKRLIKLWKIKYNIGNSDKSWQDIVTEHFNKFYRRTNG